MTKQKPSLPEDFNKELTPGSIKPAMKAFEAKSSDLWKIDPHRLKKIPDFNVRQDNDELRAHIRNLANSMKVEGYYQHKPMAGYVASEGGESVIYIFDGNCRLDAVLLAIAEGADIPRVPVVVSQDGVDMEDMTAALVHTAGGKPLAPFELAVVCKRMCRFGNEPEVVADRIGLTVPYVKDLLLLISAPMSIRQMVIENRVSAAVAITMVKKHGDKAVEKLQHAEKTATAAGKTRVTPKFVAGAAVKKMVKKSAERMFSTLADIKSDPGFSALKPETRDQLIELLAVIEKAKEDAASANDPAVGDKEVQPGSKLQRVA